MKEKAAPTPLPDLARLHARMVEAVEAAGSLALADFCPGGETRAKIHLKSGNSPVTDADFAVDAFLARALGGAEAIPYHSEERPESWTGGAEGAVFIADPIDGTRDFIAGGDMWCIVVGLLVAGEPAAGAIHVPARGLTFSAWRGGGAFLGRNALRAPAAREGAPRATGPRAGIEALAGRMGERLESGAAIPALAHRLVAPLGGTVDLALARSGGHEWDIAAAHAILAEAGGALMTMTGAAPAYPLDGSPQPPLIAAGPALAHKIRAALLTKPV